MAANRFSSDAKRAFEGGALYGLDPGDGGTLDLVISAAWSSGVLATALMFGCSGGGRPPSRHDLHCHEYRDRRSPG